MKRAVLLALLLAGCQTTEERLASEDATCQSYGVQPGSPGYLQCRMMKDQQHNADAARRQAAIQGALSDMQTNIRAPGGNQQRCVSRQVGTQVVTDCY
jgi:hypothetical protein